MKNGVFLITIKITTYKIKAHYFLLLVNWPPLYPIINNSNTYAQQKSMLSIKIVESQIKVVKMSCHLIYTKNDLTNLLYE